MQTKGSCRLLVESGSGREVGAFPGLGGAEEDDWAEAHSQTACSTAVESLGKPETSGHSWILQVPQYKRQASQSKSTELARERHTTRHRHLPTPSVLLDTHNEAQREGRLPTGLASLHPTLTPPCANCIWDGANTTSSSQAPSLEATTFIFSAQQALPFSPSIFQRIPSLPSIPTLAILLSRPEEQQQQK